MKGDYSSEQKREETVTLAHAPKDTMVTIDVSATGLIAVGSWDNFVRIFMLDGQHRFTYAGHTDTISTVAWSPDEKWIASGSHDKTVRVWNASSGELRWIDSGHVSLISCVSWSPDGRFLASASWDKTVHVVDTRSGALTCIIAEHEQEINGVSWSPSGDCLVSGDTGGVIIICANVPQWRPGGPKVIATYRLSSPTPSTSPFSPVDVLAWSPDGSRIAVGGQNAIQVRASRNGRALVSHLHQEPIRALCWSRDGGCIASTTNQEVHVWDATNGHMVSIFKKTTETARLWGVAWTPDDRRIIVGRKEPPQSVEKVPFTRDILQELPLSEELLQIGSLGIERRYIRLARWLRRRAFL